MEPELQALADKPFPPQIEAIKDRLWREWQPVTNDEETLLRIYVQLRYQQERIVEAESAAMDAALAEPQNLEKVNIWKWLMKTGLEKQRQVTQVLKQLLQFYANRHVATQISEEYNKEVPPHTPFLELQNRGALRSVVNTYTIALAGVFPLFEPIPVEPEGKKPVHKKRE